MDTKILAAKNLLKDFFGGHGMYYVIGIGFLVLFFVSKRSKFITDIFSLPFQIFRAVQSMLLIALLVLLAFLVMVLYKIWMIISLFVPVASFVADDRGAHNVKEEQVDAKKIETPKKQNTSPQTNPKEQLPSELSEEAKIAAILAQLDEYDFTPTRREKFWYEVKSWVARHYLDILVTIAIIIVERLFSRWRAKKHQSNIRYRERIRQKYREARRKKNFWLDPLGTIVNLPFFAVLGSRLGEDGQIETEMEEWGSQNVIIPNAPNAPNQPQKKISKILALAKKNKRTIFFVLATIIASIITILVVRYLLKKKQTEPNLPGIDISEEQEEQVEEPNQEEEERKKKEEEETAEPRLEEKEEEALISELSEDMDQEEEQMEEPKQEGEESEVEPSEEDNDGEKTSKLTDEEAEEGKGKKAKKTWAWKWKFPSPPPWHKPPHWIW